jgi:transcriptional/translational regulatory protein YebC/TACO1
MTVNSFANERHRTAAITQLSPNKIKIKGEQCCVVMWTQQCSAKNGGDNPNVNKRLRDIIDSARKAGVPKDIIERNLKRATEKGTDLQEHIIEVYGPGGSAYVMDCMTDNKQRAATDIWTIVKKLNGKVCALARCRLQHSN